MGSVRGRWHQTVPNMIAVIRRTLYVRALVQVIDAVLWRRTTTSPYHQTKDRSMFKTLPSPRKNTRTGAQATARPGQEALRKIFISPYPHGSHRPVSKAVALSGLPPPAGIEAWEKHLSLW